MSMSTWVSSARVAVGEWSSADLERFESKLTAIYLRAGPQTYLRSCSAMAWKLRDRIAPKITNGKKPFEHVPIVLPAKRPWSASPEAKTLSRGLMPAVLFPKARVRGLPSHPAFDRRPDCW